MQRSKQQAVMFLLGAVLVGGVLGFSADRVFDRHSSKHWARRQAFYDDLGLSAPQRSTMDSLLDDRNCQIGAVMKPVKPQLDSIRRAAHEQIVQILTPPQRERLDKRTKEMDERADEKRDGKPTTVCKG
jgi:Spy/CpxP family protein refolding chaperone